MSKRLESEVRMSLNAMALDLQSPNPFKTHEEKLSIIDGYVHDLVDILDCGECENIAYYPLVNFECSECGCAVYGGDELGADIQHGEWNRCPNCGKAVKR